jgi:GNAT superfamily N-acetyltransferase
LFSPNIGAGIGGRLLDRVLDEARRRGYVRVQLWTHAGNQRARRLYEQRGFERTGREKGDDRGELFIHYARRIAAV